MQLKQISRIVVQFSPWTGEARSAREFLARVTSAPAHASNPDCKVEHRVMVKSEPVIEIEFENKSVERIVTTGLGINQIVEAVQAKAQEMDTAAKLKARGFGQGQTLHSPWQMTAGKETDVGKTARVNAKQ